MVAASFLVLFFWIAVLFIGCVGIAALADWLEHRSRRRRVIRLIRQYGGEELDDRQPQPWNRPW